MIWKSVCSWQLATRHGSRNHGRGSTRRRSCWVRVDVETARSHMTVTAIVGGHTVGSGHGVGRCSGNLRGAQIGALSMLSVGSKYDSIVAFGIWGRGEEYGV